MSNSYSKKELQLLCSMLMDQSTDSECLLEEKAQSIAYNDYNLIDAYDAHFNTVLKTETFDGNYWEQETIYFMEETPYDQVPLYINHKPLSIFAKWRLKIGH